MSYDFSTMAFVTKDKIIFKDSFIFHELHKIEKQGDPSEQFLVAFENDY